MVTVQKLIENNDIFQNQGQSKAENQNVLPFSEQQTSGLPSKYQENFKSPQF